MAREDKCISLELAKQIDVEHKRLGVVVKGVGHCEYVWLNSTEHKKIGNGVYSLTGHRPILFSHYKNVYPAYDTSELGEMIISHVDNMPSWIVTEAEARGKVYLWLLKEGYIKGVDNGE